MDSKPPGKSIVREIAESVGEAGLSMVPFAGGPLAVAFKTAVGWRVARRAEDFLAAVAQDLNDLHERVDDLDFEKLADDPVFVDAVMTAARAAERTSQAEKISALRNAVVNSAGPDAPDADTQAIFFGLVDRFTPSHLRMLAMWDDPQQWFADHGLTRPTGGFSASRTQTVEAGLEEMRGRRDFYLLIAGELQSAQLLTASLSGMVSQAGLMNRLTTDFGRQFLIFIRPPG